jgi:hypothetical protein
MREDLIYYDRWLPSTISRSFIWKHLQRRGPQRRHLHDTAVLHPNHPQTGACPCKKIETAKESPRTFRKADLEDYSTSPRDLTSRRDRPHQVPKILPKNHVGSPAGFPAAWYKGTCQRVTDSIQGGILSCFSRFLLYVLILKNSEHCMQTWRTFAAALQREEPSQHMPRSIALLEPAAFFSTNCSGNRTKLVIGHAPSIGIQTRGSARIGDIT